MWTKHQLRKIVNRDDVAHFVLGCIRMCTLSHEDISSVEGTHVDRDRLCAWDTSGVSAEASVIKISIFFAPAKLLLV